MQAVRIEGRPRLFARGRNGQAGRGVKRTPLNRYTPLRKRSKTSKHARRERHFGYMLAQKQRDCVVCEEFGNEPRCKRNEDYLNEAAHIGPRIGHRASDLDTVSMGAFHHRMEGWDTYSGPFKDWTKEQRTDWATRQIARARIYWIALGEACLLYT